jgi:hypothetical protein
VVGWVISLLAERYKKQKMFSAEWYDEHPPRFLFIMIWPVAILIYLGACLYVFVDNSRWYDKVVKFIRGF